MSIFKIVRSGSSICNTARCVPVQGRGVRRRYEVVPSLGDILLCVPFDINVISLSYPYTGTKTPLYGRLSPQGIY